MKKWGVKHCYSYFLSLYCERAENYQQKSYIIHWGLLKISMTKYIFCFMSNAETVA